MQIWSIPSGLVGEMLQYPEESLVTTRLYFDVMWRPVWLRGPVSYTRRVTQKPEIQSYLAGQKVEAWRTSYLVLRLEVGLSWQLKAQKWVEQ